MKFHMVLAACACAALSCSLAAAQLAPPSPRPTQAMVVETAQMLSQVDRQFLHDAYASNLAAIELGKLAVSQGTNSAVKAFGQRIVDEQSAANEKLQTIARAQQRPLAASPLPVQRKAYSTLQGLLGDTFDHGYAKAAVGDRYDAVQLFTAEEQRGTNPALRAYAVQTLSILRAQLALAKTMPQG